MTDPTAIPKLRLGLALWAAGMARGSIAITTMVLPQLLGQVQQEPLPAPLWVISLASLVRSALFYSHSPYGLA